MDEELKSYLEALETRLREHSEAMETRLREHVSKECEKVETKLLTAFHGWARPAEIKVRGAAQTVAGFDERLDMAEERIGALERRIETLKPRPPL